MCDYLWQLAVLCYIVTVRGFDDKFFIICRQCPRTIMIVACIHHRKLHFECNLATMAKLYQARANDSATEGCEEVK